MIAEQKYKYGQQEQDRNIEKWLQTTPEDWNNKSIKWIYGET